MDVKNCIQREKCDVKRNTKNASYIKIEESDINIYIVYIYTLYIYMNKVIDSTSSEKR